MKEILMETYTILLPILLGYIVWLLKEQRKTAENNRRAEGEKRDAISRGDDAPAACTAHRISRKMDAERVCHKTWDREFHRDVQYLPFSRWEWYGNTSHGRSGRAAN